MDSYMYNLDPYRQASAGYYAPRYPPSYALERRSAYGLPSVDPLSPYARVPIDGYGAPAPYQPEIVPRYVSAPTSPPFRSRPRPPPKKRGAPPQNLSPKKKPFKQTQKVRFSEEKDRPSSKKDTPRKPSQPAKKIEQTHAKAAPVSQASSLVKETQELHKLFRTGVDTSTFEGKKGDSNGTAKKRKADTQTEKQTPTKNSKSAKKQKGKKENKLANVKFEKVLTEEELKEAEAALEMQRGLCQSVSQFLGIPEIKEVAYTEGVAPDGKVEDSKEPEKDSTEIERDSKETEKKPEEPQRTPEEEKEVEAKSFKYFSSLFAEHVELRNLYIDKCNSGAFECLVCLSSESKKSKKFWNVVSLVMHSNMRHKMRAEHSGYGRAVSAVLGWDPENIPKVPRIRPAAPADQGKDVVKQEAVEKALEDQKEIGRNAREEEEEENASECPAEDVKEE